MPVAVVSRREAVNACIRTVFPTAGVVKGNWGTRIYFAGQYRQSRANLSLSKRLQCIRMHGGRHSKATMQNKPGELMNLNAVAKKAGVSTATVSRVLNDLDVVKSSTRARVLKAAQDLNYHPNLHARSLARGKSRILGIIVSNMENPFFLDIYRTLEADARAHGHEVVVANTDYQSQQL